MSALGEFVARLIKADMAVVADAQQLNVHTAHAGDDFFVVFALGFRISCQAVRDKSLGFVDIHMVKQVVVHKIAVALVVVAGKADVLVQIYSAHFAEIYPVLVILADQFLICLLYTSRCV